MISGPFLLPITFCWTRDQITITILDHGCGAAAARAHAPRCPVHNQAASEARREEKEEKQLSKLEAMRFLYFSHTR